MVIAMEEVAFPRGSTKLHADGTKEHHKHQEDDLFKLGEAYKKKKRKAKSSPRGEPAVKKEKIEGSGFYVDIDANIVEPISSKVIMQGMLMMGCIIRIKKYEIMVSLPNSLVGTVSITDISDAYTAQLKSFAENDSGDDEVKQQPAPLRSMFAVGSYVICKVKEIAPLKNDKARITLTLNPRELHDEITQYVLYHDMILTAAVVSAEDHGYVMDVGIRGLAAFLKLEKTQGRFTKKGQQLAVGQLLMCVINMPDTDFEATNIRSLDLDATPRAVTEAVPKKVNKRTLLPGTKLTGTITKITKHGIILRASKHKGLVMTQHLLDPFQTLQMQELRQEVKGRILCVHPVTKGLYMSLQKRVVQLFPAEQFAGLRYGDIVEEAEVVDVIKGSVLFRLAKGVKGIAPPSKLPVKKKEIEVKFPVGSVHRCMVRRLKPMDNVVMVSLKIDDLSNVVLHLEDLKPGDLVQCAVKDHQVSGIGVMFRGGIRGFIPVNYIADKPLKNRQKALKPGTSLSCRILKVVKEKNLVILTNKQSMVNSDLPIIASYQDAQQDMIVEGCIECIFDRFFLVAFYNNVKGFVSIGEIEGSTVCLSGSFKPGQLVRCKVLASYPKTCRLKLTMKNLESSVAVPLQQDCSNFSVGELVSCRVTGVTATGLDVEILPSGIRAILPVYHISDNMANCPALLRLYSSGDVIDKVLCFSNAKTPIVTLKQVFINWVEKGEAVSSVDSLKMGMLVPLVVKNLGRCWVFVTLLHGITSLIPIRLLSSSYVIDINQCGLKPQQSLVGEVAKVEEGKVEFSLVPVNSLAVTQESRMAFFADFLAEQNRIRQHFLLRGQGKLRILAAQVVGSIINFNVKEVNTHGAIGEIAGGIKALVTKEHMWSMRVEVGQTVQALVLALDFADCCIDLLIDELVVKGVQSALARTSHVVFPCEQAYRGIIVLIKEDYMLAYINHKGCKRLVHLPTKRHLNHVPNFNNLPKYGEDCIVILKNISDISCVGILSTDTFATKALREEEGVRKRPKRPAVAFVALSKKQIGKKGQDLKRPVGKVKKALTGKKKCVTKTKSKSSKVPNKKGVTPS